MEKIRQWRNQQLQILRQARKLTKNDQIYYYENIVKPTFTCTKPSQIILAFIFNKQLVGYGGLVHISWENLRGEVSFLLDTKRGENLELYEKEFRIFLKLIRLVAFEHLHLNKIFTETFSIREHHIKILEEDSFIREGVLRQHVKIDNQYFDSILHGAVVKC